MTSGIVVGRLTNGVVVVKRRTASVALTAIVIVGGVLAGVPSAAGHATAGQQEGKKGNGTTFEGSCALEGTVHFEPGATVLTQQLRYEFEGKGTCTGRLNGTGVKDVPIAAQQEGRAEGSCAQAHTTRPGTGALTFPNGEVLTFTLEFAYQFPETNFTWYGSRSGTARGKGTFRTNRTPPDTTARCATPDGASDVPMDLSLETETPLVSRKH